MPLYDVILVEAGKSKLGVVKTLKDLSGLGLKEAKDLVDNPGSILFNGVDDDQAIAYQEAMGEAGAVTEIVEHKKGSDDFHKSIAVSLESGPVYASSTQVTFKVLDNGSIATTSELFFTDTSGKSFRINYKTKSGETKFEEVIASNLNEAISKLPDLAHVNYHMGG